MHHGSEHALSTHQKAVIATIIGNGFEWFDFTCYSFFATIIAKIFFPASNDLNSLLLVTATFGVGFFMRPVGGILLGIYADRVGRKQALWLTMLLMTIGTLLIGLAPTYEQIGIWGPIIIVISRLLQGFSAGGEMASATAFLIEHSPKGKKGYYTSWIQASIGFAVLLGATTGTLLTLYLTPEDLRSWGWRLPFLFGILLGPVGLYIRNRIIEPRETTQCEHAKTPLRDVIKHYPREVIISFSLVVLWTICSYVLLFYIPTYTVSVLHLPTSHGFIAVMLGGTVVLFFSPIFGALSDRFGRKIFLAIAASAIFILAYPMFALLNTWRGMSSLLLFQLLFGLCIACYEGPILVAMAELFPEKIISTGISLSYNLAVTLFGGFAAMILTWLIATTENPLAPVCYVMVAAAISLSGIFFMTRIPAPRAIPSPSS
jgi:MHS family proline/betaine transporter-like MFS transporter